MSRDTVGHQMAKGKEKEQQRKSAENVLQVAKIQQAKRKGKYVYSSEKRGYVFIKINK